MSEWRPLHVDARRHLQGRLLPRRRSACRHRGARRLPAAGDGLARSAPDRRHGRRRSADLEGRGRVEIRHATASMSTICSCRCSSISRSSPTRRIAATCSPASAPSRSSAGWSRRRTARRRVAIFMVNTGQIAVATVQTPGGVPTYDGDARIDGVPGSAAPIPLEFRDTAGSSCGALLPTGNAVDMIDGVDVHADRQRHAVRRSRAADSASPARDARGTGCQSELRAKTRSDPRSRPGR